MRRKGISPLIAAVLLIAFTMAVASLFAQWAPQLVQDAQGDTSERAEDIQKCSDRTLDIQGDVSSATVEQTGGTEPIGELVVTWYYDGQNPVQTSTNISSVRGIKQVSSGVSSGNLSRIEADPTNCPGAPTATYTPQ